jgi:hypothetical protein
LEHVPVPRFDWHAASGRIVAFAPERIPSDKFSVIFRQAGRGMRGRIVAATSRRFVSTATLPSFQEFPMKIRTSLLAIALSAVAGTAFAADPAPMASPASDAAAPMASDAAAPAAAPMAKHHHHAAKKHHHHHHAAKAAAPMSSDASPAADAPMPAASGK